MRSFSIFYSRDKGTNDNGGNSMYILTYKEIGTCLLKTRYFKYLEDMEIYIKKLNPTEVLTWREE